MGGLSAQADASQLAALLATLENISTEVHNKAQFDSPAMSCGTYPVEVAPDASAPGLYSVSLEIPEACMIAVSDAREDLQLADSTYFAAPSGGPVQLLLGAPCVRLGLEGRPDSGQGLGKIYLSMISPVAWAAPNLGVYIPLTDVCVGSKGDPEGESLVCKIGAKMPTPRMALRGDALNPNEPEQGTQLPPNAPVCLTLGDIQIEVKPPAKSGGIAPASGTLATNPALQSLVAVGSATANVRLSVAEYLACSALLTAMKTPLLRHDSQSSVPGSTAANTLLLHFSLATLQASLQCANSKSPLSRSSGGKSHFQASKFSLSYEQRVSKVPPA